DTTPTETYTLSLHDALPIYRGETAGEGHLAHPSGHRGAGNPDSNGQVLRDRSGPLLRWGSLRNVRLRHLRDAAATSFSMAPQPRSEEHTSELQSRFDLVCRL